VDHKIYFDEDSGVARIDLHGPIHREDAQSIIRRIDEVFKDQKHRYLLNDVSGLPSLQIDKITRRTLQEGGKKLAIEKIAVLGASPMIRMIAKVVIGVLGNNTDSKFFKTYKEAVDWLKEGKKQ
jgi:hypothetical protein